MNSLMDSIRSLITPELTSSLGSRFAIPADAVTSGLQTSSAAILTALASRAHDSTFLDSIHHLFTGSGTTVAAAAGAFGASQPAAHTENNSQFLNLLFGNHLTAVENKVASSANIPVPAGGAIMTAAAPLVENALSNRMHAEGFGLAALGAALTAELPSLRHYLPSNFAIPGLVTGGVSAKVSPAAARAVAADVSDARSSGWLWPVILLGAFLIGGLIWFFSQSKDVASAVPEASSSAIDPAQSATPALGAFFKKKLPDGTELNLPENGIENKLIAFIEDRSKPVDKETWFDFDRLLFATGSATLEPSSKEQLDNVAAILKAYPNVHLRIGGYTDNTGNPQANLKLSQDRASAVLTQLASLGVSPARLDAKGYGEDHAVADNGTDAGRAQNRRTAIRVTQK